MAHRPLAAVLLVCLTTLAPLEIAAQEPAAAPPEAAPAVVTPMTATRSSDTGRTAAAIVLRSLYAATVTVQGVDAGSTLTALRLGARENNPLMRPFTSSRPAFLAVKAGIAAGAILLAHGTAKHSRTKAVIGLVAINAAYGAFIAHNYSVIRQMRAQRAQ